MKTVIGERSLYTLSLLSDMIDIMYLRYEMIKDYTAKEILVLCQMPMGLCRSLNGPSLKAFLLTLIVCGSFPRTFTQENT